MRASSRQTCSQEGAPVWPMRLPIVAASWPSGAPNSRTVRGPEARERARSATDSMLLLDNFIRAREDRLRDGQPERGGGFEIEDQFEFGRLLDRQIARLGARQDAAYVHTEAAIHPGNACPVTRQPAGFDEFAPFVHVRHGIVRGESD